MMYFSSLGAYESILQHFLGDRKLTPENVQQELENQARVNSNNLILRKTLVLL